MRETDVKTSESIAAEAADWYARLRGEHLSELDAVRFRTWLAGDPLRRTEFEAITRFWDELGAIEDAPEVRRIKASINARREARARPRPRSATMWVTAAAVVLALGVYLVGTQIGKDTYLTQVGEQRTVPLEDGSVVKLNTDTKIRLQYSAAAREVVLISGQASFEVAKDATRPFVVIAGNGRVRAIGTVFDVYKSGDQVQVTLIEGRVAVEAASADLNPDRLVSLSSQYSATGASSEIVMTAGEQLSFGGEVAAAKPVPADLRRATAWQSRKLDFSDTPVREAIAEANRYSREQIVLHAPELGDAKISGTFEAGKNELLAQGLQAYFHLELERRPDRTIVLTSSGRTPQK
jgi:transmembrane sensor